MAPASLLPLVWQADMKIMVRLPPAPPPPAPPPPVGGKDAQGPRGGWVGLKKTASTGCRMPLSTTSGLASDPSRAVHILMSFVRFCAHGQDGVRESVWEVEEEEGDWSKAARAWTAGGGGFGNKW